jgi:formylmethanofuran dehydrogenase subunit E
MRVETPKQRKYTQDLLNRAIEFHGHGGPFMVLGLRIGLIALKKLDAHGWFDLRCRAKLHWGPPDSCIVDGIQISSGCTTGKHNIEVEEDTGTTIEFTKEGTTLTIGLKKEVLERMRGVLASNSEYAVKTMMSEFAEAPEEDMFDIALT